MAAADSDGSPVLRTKGSVIFEIHHDQQDDAQSAVKLTGSTWTASDSATAVATPLTTSKLSNQLPQSVSELKTPHKKQKLEHHPNDSVSVEQSSMDKLLAKLSHDQALLDRKKAMIASNASRRDSTSRDAEISSNSTVSMTPASNSIVVTPGTDDEDSGKTDVTEMHRLKEELLQAKKKLAKMDQELSQTRITKHMLDQTLDVTETNVQVKGNVTDQTISHLQNAFNASTRQVSGRQDTWAVFDDTNSDHSDALSAGTYNRGQGIWTNPTKPNFQTPWNNTADQQYQDPTNSWFPDGQRPWPQNAPGLGLGSQGFVGQNQQTLGFGSDDRFNTELPQFGTGSLRRSNTQNNRGIAPYNPRNMSWQFPNGINSSDGVSSPPIGFQSQAMYRPSPTYQPRPIGTPLSPTAAEFTVPQSSGNPWNSQPASSPVPTYVSPLEPLNYRRLLDRTVTCNWKYIVDKIVCNNDQQASIFLQQKLKLGTDEQKFEIVEAIIAQAYPLMINRFGNFLVQRCFEHGTPEQVIAIANAIRGNTLNLSMDAFGCHVVQKAFDCVPEDYKAIMVHELLRRIPETVIHRYACHVWQKLFELRWSDSPPQIMKYVNESLRGMWHEVALGETGSLVVQNIFENCLEEDKRPCIEEVLASIDIVAHGQFGNWCIQHICEHGGPADRSRAIDHILRYATEYSMDQYASKVVEKCLKIGGMEFLDRYLSRVCEGHPDRPRIPLIDIASDQYGNYLIQYILTNATPQHRDLVVGHIRKHMVSLRGSKYGSRVGLLCGNSASATRPGPGVGPSVNRFMTPRFGGGGAYR